MFLKIILQFLSIFTLSALGGEDPLNSWRARGALLGAGLLNAACDFTRLLWNHTTDNENVVLPEELIVEEPVATVEILENASPEVTEVVNAVEELIIAPQELYEHRYLPNSIDINDEWAREVILPTTDNNCAVFGIYGRHDVTRQEVVNTLTQAAADNSPLAQRIRELVAPEILGYLVDAQNPRVLANRMGLLAGNHLVILNLLRSTFQTYQNNEGNATQLMNVLRNRNVFSNYLHNVVDRRLGDSEEDSYPELTLIRDGENLLGVIAAIAAQQGVTLNVHQNINRQIILQGTYNHNLALRPNIEARVVDLIHTTADPLHHPNALNHFNLLERCGALQTVAKVHQEVIVQEPTSLVPTVVQEPALLMIAEVKNPERVENDVPKAIAIQETLIEVVAEEVKAEAISTEAAFYREMRAKKERQKRESRNRRSPNTALSFRTVESIGALLPAEQRAFEEFLLTSMTAHERNIYDSFIQAENNALTLKEINEFAIFMAKYLKDFLSKRLHINGQCMYTDQAIAVFLKSILEGHQKSKHHWHNPSGKKIDGSWIKYRYRTWIEHGIFEARGATRTDHTATATREQRLNKRQSV